VIGVDLEKHVKAAKRLPQPCLTIGGKRLDSGNAGDFRHVNPGEKCRHCMSKGKASGKANASPLFWKI